MSGWGGRKAKYHNKKIQYHGLKFDSKAECERFKELQLLQNAGKIQGLVTQPKYMIQRPYTNGNGEKVRAIYYVADFAYTTVENGSPGDYVIEDVKGYKTDVYQLKKKLFEWTHKPWTVTEVDVKKSKKARR